MPLKTIFKRYEIKYLITKAQKQMILEQIKPYMSLDRYGRSKISNIYFDTDTYLLIRRSIEKPTYKEKLRIRKYSTASNVFVELKKKYKHIVYKRRLTLTEKEALSWLVDKKPIPQESQISREIDYFKYYYKTLHPALFLSYEREAFYSNDGSDFRVTFDDNVVCRQNDFNFSSNAPCIPIIPDDKVLMEIKCSGGMPIWMTSILSNAHIYKTSFSKYGTAYKNIILPKLLKENVKNAR